MMLLNKKTWLGGALSTTEGKVCALITALLIVGMIYGCYSFVRERLDTHESKEVRTTEESNANESNWKNITDETPNMEKSNGVLSFFQAVFRFDGSYDPLNLIIMAIPFLIITFIFKGLGVLLGQIPLVGVVFSVLSVIARVVLWLVFFYAFGFVTVLIAIIVLGLLCLLCGGDVGLIIIYIFF